MVFLHEKLNMVKHFSFLIFCLFCTWLPALTQSVQLPAPDTTGGAPLMKVLDERQSQRDFIDSAMSSQQISDLLWAAYGINRPESGKRTAPSAMNKQEFDIYLADKNGIYVWTADSNNLQLVVAGDYRGKMGKQGFVAKASLVLVFVADYDRMGKMSDEEKDFYSAADCGYISQNVYLYAASAGLSTVVLGYIDREKMKELLKLGENQHVIFSQPVGYGAQPAQ